MSLRRKRTLLILFVLFGISTIYATFDYSYYLHKRQSSSIKSGEDALAQIQLEFNEYIVSIKEHTLKKNGRISVDTYFSVITKPGQVTLSYRKRFTNKNLFQLMCVIQNFEIFNQLFLDAISCFRLTEQQKELAA